MVDGETQIAQWLSQFRIRHEREWSPPNGPVGEKGGKLRFDFRIVDMPILIEFDGKQHRSPFYKDREVYYRVRPLIRAGLATGHIKRAVRRERYRANKTFLNQKIYDETKTKWAADNGFQLCRFYGRNFRSYLEKLFAEFLPPELKPRTYGLPSSGQDKVAWAKRAMQELPKDMEWAEFYLRVAREILASNSTT